MSISTNRIAKADAYRKVAQFALETRCVGCWAISYAPGIPTTIRSRLGKPFARMFKPEIEVWEGGWFGSTSNNDNQNHRVMALCFMAAMVEAGDA